MVACNLSRAKRLFRNVFPSAPHKGRLSTTLSLLVLAFPINAQAQQNPALTPDLLSQSLLQDFNGDGTVSMIAFGDSITYGEGDFQSPDSSVSVANHPARPAGYPNRVEGFLGVPVANAGVGGEQLLDGGLPRMLRLISQFRPDILLIMEGSNDARVPVSAPRYHRAIQTAINVATALGVRVVIGTVPLTCCGHSFLQGAINTYNPVLRSLAVVNNFQLADVSHAMSNYCGGDPSCRLLNRPEGLHPNILGYDVIGETFTAALLKIDLFAPDGPTLLAQALGIPPTDINTPPDPVPVTTP